MRNLPIPQLTEGAAEDWQLVEALLIGARSLAEVDEVLSLSESLTDEVLGEWAADGRYEWLEQLRASLPATSPLPPVEHDYSEAEAVLMYRLVWCQSLAEAKETKQALMQINSDFAGRYWSKLSAQQKRRLRALPAQQHNSAAILSGLSALHTGTETRLRAS